MEKKMLNNHWDDFLKEEFNQSYFKELSAFLSEQYKHKTIYPTKEEVFSAFAYTDYPDIKVVILGQDPYHQPGQAHGLSFSVKPSVALPPSLKNIYKELVDDLNVAVPSNGCLIPWAKQGVLLLNAVLTVEKNQANSHANQGWEQFTDHVIEKCNEHSKPVVFVLWGRNAQKKEHLIMNAKHLIIKTVHPSPLSAYQGFFGSKPFSKINSFLLANNRNPIDWSF
jgi:uracil-DNA glycosylase